MAKVVAGRWDSPFMTRLKSFVDLAPADSDALRALIKTESKVDRRHDLVVDGYAYSKLSFVKEGFAARCRLLRNGKRQIVNVLVPGDVVGLPGSFVDRATFSVFALTDMRLELCSFEDFVAASYRRPKLALALSWLAVQEANTYAERVVDIGRRTPLERVAHFLLEIHARLLLVGRATSLGFDLPVSQEIMSDVLGLSVPHVNRMLTKLRGDGVIRMAERRVEFVDSSALELLAHFQPATLSRIPSPISDTQELSA
ncbi:MAG: Crp/Fnr family transcriptional regulator [Reyranellaceae bacterium]